MWVGWTCLRIDLRAGVKERDRRTERKERQRSGSDDDRGAATTPSWAGTARRLLHFAHDRTSTQAHIPALFSPFSWLLPPPAMSQLPFISWPASSLQSSRVLARAVLPGSATAIATVA